MVAKFIDEHKIDVWKPNEKKVFYYEDENGISRVMTNPTEKFLLAHGYKEVIYSSIPQYDRFRQYIEFTYTDGEKITKNYIVKEV